MEKRDVRSIITPSRLDVFTKTAFVRGQLSGEGERWASLLYSQYLDCIEPKNGFSENGTKFSLEDYVKDFRSLIESLRTHGFDCKFGCIPIGSDGIVNGSHRTAASLVMGLQVCVEESHEKNQKYDYKFLREVDLNPDLIDAVILDYCNQFSNIKILCLIGCEKNKFDEIVLGLEKTNKIIYTQEIELSNIGARRIIQILYGLNDWWSEDLIEPLFLERFSTNKKKISFIFFHEESLEKVFGLKAKIRQNLHPGISFKTIHSTDNQVESIRVAQCVLNANSVHYLNNAPIGSENNLSGILTSEFSKMPKLNRDKLVVVGSSVLEMYGIRQAADIDVIHADSESELIQKSKVVSSHNKEYRFFPLDISDLINDPRLYFYSNGVKFMSLSILLFFKLNRYENKDIEDVKNVLDYKFGASLYSQKRTQGLAIRKRRGLIVRKKVEGIISFLPDSWEIPIKSIYIKSRKYLKLFISR